MSSPRVAQDDEQHDAHVAVPILGDHEALEHVVERIDLAVDLGGSDAHATGVERRVGATVDDHAAVLGPLGEVALVPGARESLEVGGVVTSIAGIVPEAERHRGERRTAHELARGARPRRAPVVVEHVDGHPEARPLDLAGPDRPRGIAGDEAAAQVRPTGDGSQVHVALHVPVHVLEPFGHERRTGRRDGPQRGEVVRLDRFAARAWRTSRGTSPRCRRA